MSLKPLVIFGLGKMAEVVFYYFTKENKKKVIAFCVDNKYKEQTSFNGIPIITQDYLVKNYNPGEIEIFVAMGYKKINLLRKNKYLELKSLGFKFSSFISSNCSFKTTNQVGENTLILEDNTIQPFVRIGNNVIIWSGNHIGHHSQIKDHCFITSHSVISGGCTIGEQSFIGVNSTITEFKNIGEKTLIGAGSLINSDTDAESVYYSEIAIKSKVPSSRIKL